MCLVPLRWATTTGTSCGAAGQVFPTTELIFGCTGSQQLVLLHSPTSQHSLTPQGDKGAGEQLPTSFSLEWGGVSAISLIVRRHILGCALAADEQDDSHLPVCRMRCVHGALCRALTAGSCLIIMLCQQLKI